MQTLIQLKQNLSAMKEMKLFKRYFFPKSAASLDRICVEHTFNSKKTIRSHMKKVHL